MNLRCELYWSRVRLLTLDPSDSFHSLDRPGLYQENPVHGLCPHHQNGDTEPEQEFQSLTILTFLQVRAKLELTTAN